MKYHGAVVERLPKDVPRPGNTKGGPDFICTAGGVQYLGDVDVTVGDLAGAYTRKIREYEEMIFVNSCRTWPFTFSVWGGIERRSMETLKEIARDIGSQQLPYDATIGCQFELIRGLFFGVKRLDLRSVCL